MIRFPPIGFLVFYPATLALFAYGVRGNWPWLVSENARFEPWEVPVVWAPVATAFLLFVEHGVSQAVGKPMLRRVHTVTFRAFLVAVAFECVLVAYSVAEEEVGHARAVRTPAELVAGHSYVESGGLRRYSFTCSFADRRGARHSAWFSDTADGVPDQVRRAIDRGHGVAMATVAYDPRWPGRNWLADRPYTHDNRLFLFALLSLVFSLPLAGGLAQFRKWVPWLPTPRVAPFLGATWVLVMAVLLQGW